jgi:quinol monooxygenase YgiN
VAKPERLNETVKLIEDMVPVTQMKEGCISYTIYKELAVNYTYFILETRESKNALDQHLASVHMVNFLKEAEVLFSEPLDVRLLINL